MIAYQADWFGKFVVGLMQLLNEGIYSLVGTMCQLFMNLSEVQLFNNETIETFLGRIYVVLGILMLFKLAFSLLNSIVNPDALLDKEKGMQKVIPRTVLALAMLIFSPMVFEKAMEWQGDIALAVPRLIIGTRTTREELAESDQGEILASTALRAFIQKNEECADSDEKIESLYDESKTVHLSLDLAEMRCEATNKQFMFQFNGFVSMVVGIFLVVFLATYCIDIAIRTIKLGILRLLAPIPIITYVDPKSEKQGAFHNWIKECGSTYLELFIKLAILYFALYILSSIAASDSGAFIYPTGTSKAMQHWIKLFLILGTFFFMGKAAEFICNILGVKKPEKTGGLFKGLAGLGAAIGIGAGGLSGAITNYRGTLVSQEARGVPKNRLAALGSGALGAVTGLAVSGNAVATAQKGKMGAALAAMYKRNAAYSQAAGGGATLFGKAGAYAQRAITGQTRADTIENQIKGYDTYNKALDQVAKRVSGEMVKSVDTRGRISAGSDIYANYKSVTAAMKAAATQNLGSFQYEAYDANGNSIGMQTMTMQEYEMNSGFLLKENEDSYVKKVLDHSIEDATLERYVAEANEAGKTYFGTEDTDPKAITTSTGRDGYKKSGDIVEQRLSELRKEKGRHAANDMATKPK